MTKKIMIENGRKYRAAAKQPIVEGIIKQSINIHIGSSKWISLVSFVNKASNGPIGVLSKKETLIRKTDDNVLLYMCLSAFFNIIPAHNPNIPANTATAVLITDHIHANNKRSGCRSLKIQYDNDCLHLC